MPSNDPQLQAAIAGCATERIQYSGAIQPHGFLISCDPEEWRIRHVSANIAALLDETPAALLGQPFADFFTTDVLHPVQEAAAIMDAGQAAQRVGTANVGVLASMCDVSVHKADGLVHIEIELATGKDRSRAASVVAHGMIARLATVDDDADFFELCVQQVHALTGYDRVMVYRFDHDDAGEVVAEHRAADMEPYLGLRYPASDIPAQARTLYLRNRIRVIPTVDYVPVPLQPGVDAAGAPLDLSQHVLRSVSPVHLEYLRNMGVAASMSISIIVEDRLWGLIACHHRTPLCVSALARAACDLLGMFISLRVGAQVRMLETANEDHARSARDALVVRLTQSESPLQALRDALPTVRRTLPCTGAALWMGGQWTTDGHVPDASGLQAALEWVQAQRSDLTATDVLTDWREGAVSDGIAGVLAVRLGDAGDGLLLFRDERVQHVRWAGEPHKYTVHTDDGLRIAPRRSFAEWQQTVHGHSTPWTAADQRLAMRLQAALRSALRTPSVPHGASDLTAFRHRQALQQHSSRLERLSRLLAMVDGGTTDVQGIGLRIAELEAALDRLLPDTLARTRDD